MQLEIVVVKR